LLHADEECSVKQNSRRTSLEVIAPPRAWEIHVVQQWTATVARILDTHGISCLNLPEVTEEIRPGRRTVPHSSKMDHVRFGELIRSQRPGVTLIPHKRSVRLPKKQFAHWVQKVHDKHIRHIVAVGGESHTIDYPGLSVPEAAAFVKRSFPSMKVGGITIFTRKDEAERIVAKVKSGVTFFLSQIIFEASPMKQVLSDLKMRCENERLEFPDVYVSLAPAARIRDLEFMQWLGVQFPPTLLSLLANKDETRVEARTFEVLKKLIDEVVEVTAKVPSNVGVNIGHVVYDNLDLSERLIELVSSRADA
jgi:5,10-methylenetetrahydrofolate reductase